MDLNFYLAQIMALLAWIFLIISYWKNKDDKLLYLQVIACILLSLNYIFLKAYTGIFIVFFEIIRDILYIKYENDKKTFILTLPIYALIGIFTYDGILSLFSVFAALNDGYSLIYKGKKVVILGILTYTLWLIYDIYCKSYTSVIAEIIIIVSNIIILIRRKKTKKETINIRRGC